jgi:hypothetical protein
LRAQTACVRDYRRDLFVDVLAVIHRRDHASASRGRVKWLWLPFTKIGTNPGVESWQ